MIFVNPTTPVIDTAEYFSGKITDIQTLTPKLIDQQLTFCTCAMQCVQALPAFTDEVGTDFYHNDKFRMFMNTIDGGTVVAKLVNSKGVEFPVTDNTYGIKQDFAGAFYTYELNWYLVWFNLGYETYYMRIENETGAGDVVQTDQSPSFTLRKYSDRAANGTVRVETEQSGILQHSLKYIGLTNDTVFAQQIRFRGSLKFLNNVVENSDLQLNNPNRSLAQIKDQVFPEYELTLALVSSRQVAATLFDYLFANYVAISDYNVFNHPLDPRNYTADAIRSLPIKREDESSEPSVNHIKKTYRIKVAYENKNVYKINN